MSEIYVGDMDEFACDAVEGNRRWAVWENDMRGGEKLLARFDTEAEALAYANKITEIENKKSQSEENYR